MRNQARLLLQRSHFGASHPKILPTTSKVHHSLFQPLPPQISPPHFLFSFQHLYSTVDPTARRVQSVHAFTHIFAIPNKSNDQINQDLGSNNVVVTRKLVLEGLKGLSDSPDVAKRVFNWVLENDGEKVSSKSYNLMVGILGSNGLVGEFWEMVGVMKEKGFVVGRNAYDVVFKRFEEDGLSDDLEKLKALKLVDVAITEDSLKNSSLRVCRVIRRDVWGDDVETQLKELRVRFSSKLVAAVIENIGIEQNKGLIFFRWVQENRLFKHDERTYNAMARVLGKEGGTEKFWKVVDEMRNAGYEIERGSYVDLVKQFVKKKMLDSAVSLYEFAMSGTNKPSLEDTTFLLKKIVVSKEELDIDLFARVVKAYTESGNALKSEILHAVLKSLTSVVRIGECNKVLKVFQEFGFQPSDRMQSRIAYHLSSSGKAEEAAEFMNSVTESEEGLSPRVSAHLALGFCAAGDEVKAAQSFKKMLEKEEIYCAGRVLDSLVNTYCHKNNAKDAYKIVSETINEKRVHAKHSTFKTLIEKLLAQGFFKEALDSVALMTSQGYLPLLDPFVKYLPKKGTADDAITFMKAVIVKSPSISTFVQVFEAYFKAGKHREAHDFLSSCPTFIKNNAEVLNLFYSKRSENTNASSSVAA